MPELSDLRHRPEFRTTVADRLYQAWWRQEGATLADVDGLLGASLGPTLVPSCIVAHDADQFLGTASLIAADLSVRPQYTPWLAAVWVEPDARSRGIGGRVVTRVRDMALAGGVHRLFLYCDPGKESFYAGLGWSRLEHDVGPNRVTVMDWRAPSGGTAES